MTRIADRLAARLLHDDFVRLIMPKILARASWVQLDRPQIDLEELTQEAAARAWDDCLSAARRGRNPFRWPATVAVYAVADALSKQVKDRIAAGRLAELPDDVPDRRGSRPGAIAELRDWLNGQPSGRLQVGSFLGCGCTQPEVSGYLGVSVKRVRQLRNALRSAWVKDGRPGEGGAA